MSEPYYKQEYQGERKLDGEAPVFSFDQIMKKLFCDHLSGMQELPEEVSGLESLLLKL